MAPDSINESVMSSGLPDKSQMEPSDRRTMMYGSMIWRRIIADPFGGVDVTQRHVLRLLTSLQDADRVGGDLQRTVVAENVRRGQGGFFRDEFQSTLTSLSSSPVSMIMVDDFMLSKR